jgi:outer membrane protein assembly factor BamB
MDQDNKPFTPELIDTQIDQLANLAPTSSSASLIDDLRHMYQDDERSLENVWRRLGLESDVPTHIERLPATLHIVTPEEQPPANPGISTSGSISQIHRASRLFSPRTLSLVAAVLIATLVVGSMLVVLNLVHQSAKTVSPVSSSESTDTVSSAFSSDTEIYLSNEQDLFKLDTQTRQVLWKQALKDAVKIIPAGNAVYILQGNVSVAGLSNVVALDAKSGKTLWKRDFTLQTSDLVLSQNLLYVSVENWPAKLPVGTKDAGQIYVLNTKDGSIHASYPPIDSVWSLAIGNGVLGLSTDGGLRAYDAVSGKQLWQATINEASSRPKVTAMSIVDGLLYASVGGNYIAAYKAQTGEKIWQSPTFGNIASFTVDHQTVYFGTSIYLSQDQPFKGAVYAYDVQHNKQLWSKNVDGGLQQPPMISNGVVYVAADSGTHFQAHIVALMATNGAIKWQKPLDNEIIESFNLSNGVLYVGNTSDLTQPRAPIAFDALNAEDGSKVWTDTRFGSAQVIVPAE